MKKLVFAAIAAMVMVSVSNVFASKNMASVSNAAPVDTVAPADTTVSTDTVAPAEQTTDTTVEEKTADLAALINVPADTTTTDSTQRIHQLQVHTLQHCNITFKNSNNYTSLSIEKGICHSIMAYPPFRFPFYIWQLLYLKQIVHRHLTLNVLPSCIMFHSIRCNHGQMNSLSSTRHLLE